MSEQPKLLCPTCNGPVTIAHKDDIGTQFYKCEKCGYIKNPKEASQSVSTEKTEDAPEALEHINLIENPKLIGKPVTFEAVISSNSMSYPVPSELKIFYKTDSVDDDYTAIKKISSNDPINIGLVAVSKETLALRLKQNFSSVDVKAIIQETRKYRTVYMVRVRPPVFTLEKQGDKIVDEKGYEYKYYDLYVASDVPLTFQPSTLLRIIGLPLPNPRTQKTTLLAYSVEFPEDNFSYNLTQLTKLRAFFDGKAVSERLKWILENFELYSHIFGRKNIATAALLDYYSPLYVCFNGETQRGWLIVAIIGDTTTGKSETIKKMSKLHKAGSVISAETASTVGLTGTATQLEKEGWFIDWGFLPLMDRKLLAIDGSHKLNASCWAALARG